MVRKIGKIIKPTGKQGRGETLLLKNLLLKETIPKKNGEKLKVDLPKNKCGYCGRGFEERHIGKSTTYYQPTCDCQRKIDFKKEERERLKRQGEYLKDSIISIKKYTGLGKRFQDKTFNNFNKSQNKEACNICFNYVKNLKDNLGSGNGLFLYGNVGSGKTHLIAAMIDHISRMCKRWLGYKDIIFINTINLLSEIKFSFKDNTTEEVIKPYENCKLLFIDDMGTGKISDWTIEILYKIINTRYEKMLSTVVATNMTLAEIKEKIDERLFSRIYEMCKGIKLSGKDYRLI